MAKHKKHMDLHDQFEAAFGYRMPGTEKPQPKSNEVPALVRLIILPFSILAAIINFCVRGPRCIMTANSAYMALSGMFMLFSSILALFFIKDMGNYVHSLEFLGSWSTPMNGIMVLFFIVQLIRGSYFMGIANAAASNSHAFHITRQHGKFKPNQQQSSGSRKYNEIKDFKGYVNSRMSIMSNSDKEKYIKELFGGKK
jgi:hypothetical protein